MPPLRRAAKGTPPRAIAPSRAVRPGREAVGAAGPHLADPGTWPIDSAPRVAGTRARGRSRWTRRRGPPRGSRPGRRGPGATPTRPRIEPPLVTVPPGRARRITPPREGTRLRARGAPSRAAPQSVPGAEGRARPSLARAPRRGRQRSRRVRAQEPAPPAGLRELGHAAAGPRPRDRRRQRRLPGLRGERGARGVRGPRRPRVVDTAGIGSAMVANALPGVRRGQLLGRAPWRGTRASTTTPTC